MLRDYEVSIWTLQDGFITVLKASQLESKGQIQNPVMTLNVDGTNEFSFSIPMYLYYGAEKKENPKWYNVRNGNILVDMRKIKVIFNKGQEAERVFEFLITKVTERHEGGELMCDIECEGLAFHELGKIGYKIELSQDDFINEWNEWATEKYENEAEHAAREPKNNINYWCDKIFKNTKWHYSIYMDWAAYDGYVTVRYEFPSSRVDLALIDISTIWAGEDFHDEIIPYIDLTPEERATIDARRTELGLRLNTKIYEDEYVSSWTNNGDSLTPSKTEAKKEKYRLLDEKESNIYNLSQAIAETFGVYCRYEYHYDENYHIIDREVIFYNNFLQEATGTIDLTYPYSANSIEREMDGTDIVTKMFIKTLNDDTMSSGWASIMDTEANRSREDYILNFDYLYSIGTITQEQYDEIPRYESRLHDLNMEILPYESQLTALQAEYSDVSAKEAFAQNAISLDTERISAADDLLNALTEGTGVIEVTAANPDICYIIEDSQRPGTYYTTIRQTGILAPTVHIYWSYDITSQTFGNEIKGFSFESDEFNNLTGRVLHMPRPNESSSCYAIYEYEPQLYYENIKRVWIARKAADTAEYNKQHARTVELDGEKDADGNRTSDGKIQEVEAELQALYNKKAEEVAKFERMMGPALREGNWQPEDDYAKYGDKYSQTIQLNNASQFTNALASMGWDSELFDDEQKNYYELGVTQEHIYYPCIDLTNYMDRLTDAAIEAKANEQNLSIESLSFIFQDLDYEQIEDPSYFRYFPVNSQCVFGFIRKHGSTAVTPVLMITGVEDLSDESDVTNKARIGYLKTTVEESGSITNEVIDIIAPNEVKWIFTEDLENYDMVYPRIRIDSDCMKDTDDELSILRNNSLLTRYEDYSVLSRGDTDTVGEDEQEQYNIRYYITIKPDVIFRSGAINGSYRCNYTISNTGLIIYLDAIQILNENSIPKVSYTIDPSVVNTKFLEQAYNCLSKIVRINDYELKFENVRGYISELELDLDHPEEDQITITNYKTKFEDLFSNIVAQTEDMKKNAYVVGRAAQAFTATGGLNSDMLQNAIYNENLQYAFNQGTLTIDEKNGIWGTSDSGVVAYRGGGIFTATQQDSNGNWIWNTGILPSGINASMITSGQLDTNLIRIYSGNNLKLQMNADGLFAYKSWLEDDAQGTVAQAARQAEYERNSLNPGQFVVHNSEGLFLVAKGGSQVLNSDKTAYQTLQEDIKRVEISWDGLIIRNWLGDKVFFADTDGNLNISGIIYASGGEFTGHVTARSLTIGGGTEEDPDVPINEFIEENTITDLKRLDRIQEKLDYNKNPDTNHATVHFTTGRPNNPQKNDYWFNPVDKSMQQFNGTTWEPVTDPALERGLDIAKDGLQRSDTKLQVYSQDSPPTDMSADSVGDLWYDTDDNNTLYRWNGIKWALYADRTVNAMIDSIDGVVTVYYDTAAPQNAIERDLWFNTASSTTYRYFNGIWEVVEDKYLNKAFAALQDEEGIGTDFRIYAQDNEPGGLTQENLGDIFIKTPEYTLWRWNGTSWVEYRDTTLDNLIQANDNLVTVFYGNDTPSNPAEADLWYKDGQLQKYHEGSWTELVDPSLANILTSVVELQDAASGAIKVYGQNKSPRDSGDLDEGDLWIDTTAYANDLYRWNGYMWEAIDMAYVNYLIDNIDGEMTIYYTQPDDPHKNDIWYDATDPNNPKIKRWTGDTWRDITDSTMGQILQAARDAQSTADGKIKTFAQPMDPTKTDPPSEVNIGDLWIDTDENNVIKRYNGTEWITYADPHLNYLMDIVDGNMTVHYSDVQPTGPDLQELDIWYNTSNGVIQRYVDGQWEIIDDTLLGQLLKQVADAQATADGKINTYAQDEDENHNGPVGADIGDLWINTTNGQNTLYRWEEVIDEQGTHNAWRPYEAPWRETLSGVQTDLQRALDATNVSLDGAQSQLNSLEGNVKSWLHVDEKGAATFMSVIETNITNSLGKDLTDATDSMEKVLRYISVDPETGSITLGDTSSTTSVQITNDFLAFLKKDNTSGGEPPLIPTNAAAYISEDLFYMRNAVIEDGSYFRLGRFAFVPEKDHSVSFVKLGGKWED